MTLLYFDGMQDVPTSRKPEMVVSGVSAQIGRDASVNGAMSVNTISSPQTVTLPSAAATCYCGWANSVIGGNAWVLNNILMAWCTGTGVPRTQQCCLILAADGSGFFELRKSTPTGTLLGTSSGHTPLTQTAVWHSLMAKCVLGAASNGSFELYYDGVLVMSLSGITNSTVTASVESLSIAGNTSGTAGNTQNNVFWDDLWVCDGVDATATQGRANNTYLGDLSVRTLIPTANGDLTAWTKSTGTNAAALLDEVPPNTTDYISSSTSAQRELMVLPDLPATTSLVYGARVNMYAAKTDAGVGSVKPLVKEAVSGTITAQTAIPLSTTYAGYSGGFMWGKPTTPTTPWTATEINALQAGVELA